MRRATGERGQATVEFALVLPVLVFSAIAILQVELVVRDYVAVVHAAREAARAAKGPVRAALGGWVLLPGPRDPRVLAASVSDPTGTLPRMAALVEARAEAFGFPKEGRPFLAHATVARRRKDRRGRPRRGVPPPESRKGGAPAAARRDVLLDRLVLMESVLGPDGPAYAVVAETPLGSA